MDPSISVTAVNTHRVRPGREAGQGIVVQFETCQHLDSWMQSKPRRSWIERVQPMVQEPETVR